MYHLALTLGHGSSAILIHNGNILIGYENERISGIKSDSQYPSLAIQEIGKYYDLSLIESVYISHWATFGDVDDMSHKHWRRDLLRKACPNIISIHSTSDHHDCHVAALRVFAGKTYNWEIVADGFGNFNEVISIYNKGKLVNRVFGFEKSIGLLYQYTTAFLGLKMNQDEFKLLGYESKIKEVVDVNTIEKILAAADKYANVYVNNILEPKIKPKYDLVAGLEALPNIRLTIHNRNKYLLRVVLGFLKDDIDDFIKKVIIAFFVQTVTEKVFANIVTHYGMDEVGLSGGVFMNVKLNNDIASRVTEVCVYPLCGDQGAGLGAYQLVRENLIWPEHVFWGKRDLWGIPVDIKGLIVVYKLNDALTILINGLSDNKIINLVYGNMEFGARALGHTTTFALPTKENVEYINHLNDRSTIMPMAAMVSERLLGLYEWPDKVYKSLEYMIMTLDSKIFLDMFPGCHHKHPLENKWTNRVQLIKKGSIFSSILDEHGMVINTSFNYHGVPIVCSKEQIINTHLSQLENDIDNRVITIVVND